MLGALPVTISGYKLRNSLQIGWLRTLEKSADEVFRGRHFVVDCQRIANVTTTILGVAFGIVTTFEVTGDIFGKRLCQC